MTDIAPVLAAGHDAIAPVPAAGDDIVDLGSDAAPAAGDDIVDLGSDAAPVEPTVTLTSAQVDALVASAVSRAMAAQGAVVPVAGVTKPRVAPEDAHEVGDVVLHHGRPALVLDVLTRARDTGDGAHDHVLYRVGVFAEDRTIDAEDVSEA